MSRLPRSLLRPLIALLFTGIAGPCASQAGSTPGHDVPVRAAQSLLDEESFQTRLVLRALAALGYSPEPVLRVSYEAAHRAVAGGQATFMADHWDPLHAPFFGAAGGERRLMTLGTLTEHALQGYLVDRRSAELLGVHDLAQFRDPNIARHFDTDGDDRADLAGCNPGWGCQRIIDHQLRAYDLSDTVTHHAGPYESLMTDVIARQAAGRSVLYYTWTPNWVSDVLVPGRDVVWLTVPFSSQPGIADPTRTALGDGTDYGFQPNTIRIVANRTFAEAHPDARRLFELIRLPNGDIAAQNLRMHKGESSEADVERHVGEWIAEHRVSWEGWLRQAREAAR